MIVCLVPSSVPHGAALHPHVEGKHYGSVGSQSGDSHIRVIDSRSGQMHHQQEYIIDPHHAHVNVQGIAHVRSGSSAYVTDKQSSQYRPVHQHAQQHVIQNHHTKPIPGNVPPHHYMMELGLFMA
ncbi:unnamed protein product [Orchesella dallaii]|uniref:Uncharacterized protein n=1 Tax=Orchesella dallaii TaxID=48710 RepID=A0ABP1PKK5_9HEXA